MKRHSHLIGMLFNMPQLATPSLMFEAVAFASSHLGMVIVDGSELSSVSNTVLMPRVALDDSDEDGDSVRDDDCDNDGSGIVKIGIYGPLVPRTGNLKMCTVMTAYEQIIAQVNAAVADPSISRIVLDIDTNGGSAIGGFEASNAIRAAAQVKPVHAIVNFQAFSGGYLLACAASEISVSQSSGVGSIGVIAKHFDVSQMNANLGVKVTTVSRGAKKNDCSPDEPITDSSLATMNDMADRIYDQFTGTVASFRGLPKSAVVGTEAGLYWGQQAIDAGLADRLETPQEAIDRIASLAAADRQASLKTAGAPLVSSNNHRLRVAAAAGMQAKL